MRARLPDRRDDAAVTAPLAFVGANAWGGAHRAAAGRGADDDRERYGSRRGAAGTAGTAEAWSAPARAE